MNRDDSCVPLFHDEVIKTTAASWLAQREEGFTPEQEAQFLKWRLADPRHGAAIEQLEQACALLEQLPALRGDPRLDGNPRSGQPVATPVRPVVTWATWLRRAAVAACLLLGLAAWQFLRVPGDVRASYLTEPQGYQRVLLPDDSVAQLNGDTTLAVEYSRRERRVQILGGEAHFNVAKDAARPFVVTVQGVRVVAVGTAFNVRVAGATVEVLVTEGVVRVEREQGAAAGELIVVAAGERTLVTDAGLPPVVRVEPETLRAALAWQEARVVFLEAPLADLVARFNLRNRTKLELGDATLGSRVVGGTFRLDDVETFVRLLESGGDIAIDRVGTDQIVLRRAR